MVVTPDAAAGAARRAGSWPISLLGRYCRWREVHHGAEILWCTR
jgi:hypothetical protein